MPDINLPAIPEHAPLVDPRTGRINPDWLRYLTALDKIMRSL